MRQYSIDQVELSWLNLDFKEGLSAGTSIVEAITAGGFAATATANGNATRTYDPNRMGTVTVTVDQTSTIHRQLTAVWNQDKVPATRDKVGPMKMNDASSGDVVTWKNAHITNRVPVTRGTESATFAWVFNFEKADDLPSVNNLTNVVGA
jgi:hypothetical protein